MLADLTALNISGDDLPPPEYLARTWHEDMIWYGPAGIGATCTIPRYQEQHQYPFRTGLRGKRFNGHLCRLAEGNYAGFFGWPNLTNTAVGGFLGLPASDRAADMRVVDIYRREGDKLAENWVLIDLPWWLKQQGVDILKRTGQIICTLGNFPIELGGAFQGAATAFRFRASTKDVYGVSKHNIRRASAGSSSLTLR